MTLAGEGGKDFIFYIFYLDLFYWTNCTVEREVGQVFQYKVPVFWSTFGS